MQKNFESEKIFPLKFDNLGFWRDKADFLNLVFSFICPVYFARKYAVIS